jgi:quercetin dioxygenase-like cupin family protein
MINRTETITRGNCLPACDLAPGVDLRVFASGQNGARGLCTGTATFRPGAELPYHVHPISEAIVVLSGRAYVLVEGRRYSLSGYDAMHIPAQTAHQVINSSRETPAVLFSTFASEMPTRELVSDRFAVVELSATDAGCPENLIRFETAPVYELSARAFFRDLFARRLGSRGICGGYGIFEPGASLPCHIHGFDESITIVTGRAICQVAGREYELSNCDTACIPQGRPHRFINRSSLPMAMIWVYAGDEPDRTLVDPGFCEGVLPLSALYPQTV